MAKKETTTEPDKTTAATRKLNAGIQALARIDRIFCELSFEDKQKIVLWLMETVEQERKLWKHMTVENSGVRDRTPDEPEQPEAWVDQDIE